MTPTFLVAIDTGSDTDLLGIAEELHSLLTEHGFDVKSVKPWQQATLSPLIPTPTISSEQTK